jgi:deoxyribodipyrimidine photo-lyase
MTSVFIFRRDLRLQDNTALIKAIRDGYKVLPIFVFTPEQILTNKNSYFSHPAVQFMCESLIDLNDSLKKYQSQLHLFYGNNIDVLEAISKKLTIQAVYFNEDYSVYAKKRDKDIINWCKQKNILCQTTEDYGLLPLKDGLLKDERPYMVLAQFYKKIMKEIIIRTVDTFKFKNSYFIKDSFPLQITTDTIHTYYEANPQIAIHGGRSLALQGLKRLEQLKNYQEERDYPALHKTSMMSPHLKFGTVSIREMYWTIEKLFGRTHGLIRELIFRDFYLKIYALQPKLQRGTALHKHFDEAIPWSYDKKLFKAWTEGLTGYPLVDAGMRELNTTGHQHNRIRMLCGSVLTKYFLIDWRWGLKYYYTHLVDADIYSNTAGWGFVSSTGPDGVPYFRAPFNPFIQSEKFDKEVVYIQQWVPELKDVSPKDIHHWFDPEVRSKYPNVDYPAPVINHKEASARALKTFKEAYEKKFQKDGGRYTSPPKAPSFRNMNLSQGIGSIKTAQEKELVKEELKHKEKKSLFQKKDINGEEKFEDELYNTNEQHKEDIKNFLLGFSQNEDKSGKYLVSA